MAYILKKRYENHFGLDLKSSDIVRPAEYASGIKNAQYRKSGSIEKRKGYQAHSESAGGFGIFTYQRINPKTGTQEPEIIAVDSKAHKLLTAEITVTYSGTDPSCLISIFYDVSSDQYRAQIFVGGTSVLDKDLGFGFDEASTVTISDLSTDINAIADFSASTTGDSSTPASFLKIVRDYDLKLGSLTTHAKYWQEINSPSIAPFYGSESNKNSDSFENVSAVQINNILFLSNGYDEVQKYDGQNVYRAGLPIPSSISTALVVGGSVNGNKYLHVAQYIQEDAVGNFIEGNHITSSVEQNAVNNSFDVTVANIQSAEGYNTNCAIVDGLQAGVTIIDVDDGSGGSHTIKAGDTAYFYDGVTGDYVTREVLSVAATTIEIDGAAVDVADGTVISNNLRIAIYRSKTSGTTPTVFFLVAEIPNNSFAATQVFNDDTLDSALGAQFIEPLTDRSPPIKGKYISAFRNQLVTAGNIDNPNTVYYSDVDGPEYFVSGVTEFNVDSIIGDIITGIAPNNEVFAIFKQKSIHIVTGNIADGTIRVDQLTNDIGCSAHATIKEIRGALAFLSDRGPYVMIGGQIPEDLGGNRIEPVFDGESAGDDIKSFLFNSTITNSERLFNLKKAVAINDRDEEKYLLFVPTESITWGDSHTNSNAKVFAFDYERGAWLMWDNLDFSGGVTTDGNEFYFIERRYSTFNTSVDHILYRRHTLNDAYDYQDNDSAIDFYYKSNWEAVDEPSVFKKFLSLRLFSLETMTNNTLNVSVETEANYIKEVPKSQFDLSFGTSGYGVSSYGIAAYGDPSESAIKRRLLTGRYRSMRVNFSNDAPQENVIISGWELEIATPYKPEFKS